MSPWYATNARDLLETRRQGFALRRPVAVSLIGGNFEAFTSAALYVRPQMPVERLDWRMLVNLDVWLIGSKDAALDWLLATASRIAQAQPHELVLRFGDGGDWHDVEIGTGLHIPPVADLPAVHRFDWVPINCSGTRLGSQLRRALINTHARWTRL